MFAHKTIKNADVIVVATEGERGIKTFHVRIKISCPICFEDKPIKDGQVNGCSRCLNALCRSCLLQQLIIGSGVCPLCRFPYMINGQDPETFPFIGNEEGFPTDEEVLTID